MQVSDKGTMPQTSSMTTLKTRIQEEALTYMSMHACTTSTHYSMQVWVAHWIK